MTSPTTLAAANRLAPGDTAATAFAVTYPITLLTRVMAAQALVLLLV
jgi:uncharacterized transporter YbjL